MAKDQQITEAEWPLMLALWARETATAAEIVAVVTQERDTAMRTVKTLLRRLVAKRFGIFGSYTHVVARAKREAAP